MTFRSAPTLTILTALGGSLLLAAPAFAQAASPQETPAQARARAATSSLNGGPAQTTLAPRPNAQPPLTPVERPRPVQPRSAPPIAPTPPPQAQARTPVTPQVRAPASASPAQPRAGTPASPPTRSGAQAPAPTSPAASTQATSTQAGAQRPSITLAPGQTAPAPIAMPLGYYVRGDKNCDQVWPGEGDLAWFTPTSFTIDFGGCEPGQFQQTGPNAWSEEQRCMTELGGDAGVYSVTYEVIGPGTVLRRAHLAIDDRIEQDLWSHCEAADVPEQARFKP